MKRSAIVNETQPTQPESKNDREWLLRRVAEIVYSASNWGLKDDRSLNWQGKTNSRLIGNVQNTLAYISGGGEKYRNLYDFCDPGEDWIMINSGIFAKADREANTIHFCQIHRIESPGYIDRVRDEYGEWGEVHQGDYWGGRCIFGFTGNYRWQKRTWTQSVMDQFISSASALAE